MRVPVPDGMMLRYLWVRREIAEADTYVSLAKLKCHQTAGITLSTKNMFGLLPRVRTTVRQIAASCTRTPTV